MFGMEVAEGVEHVAEVASFLKSREKPKLPALRFFETLMVDFRL